MHLGSFTNEADFMRLYRGLLQFLQVFQKVNQGPPQASHFFFNFKFSKIIQTKTKAFQVTIHQEPDFIRFYPRLLHSLQVLQKVNQGPPQAKNILEFSKILKSSNPKQKHPKSQSTNIPDDTRKMDQHPAHHPDIPAPAEGLGYPFGILVEATVILSKNA